MNVRFTAWFSEEERDLLRSRARSERTSINWLVRQAVRIYLELDPVPSQLLRVTSDTPSQKVGPA